MKARRQAGERNSRAKLTERDVRAIRVLHFGLDYSLNELARMFAVSQNNVCKIVARQTWGFLRKE